MACFIFAAGSLLVSYRQGLKTLKELRGETCGIFWLWAKRERGEIREAARMMNDFSKPIGGAT